MSRIGRKPIIIPNGVDVSVGDHLVTVKGPKGTLSVTLHPSVRVAVTPEKTVEVTVAQPDLPKDRALWGLFRKLIANAVDGVQKAYEIKLEFIGVGFKAVVAGNKLNMEAGFSHPVIVELPQGIAASVEKQVLTLTGIDKQQLGEFASQIRRVRPPEPYKGKGIRYVDEVVRRKAGKAAKASV